MATLFVSLTRDYSAQALGDLDAITFKNAAGTTAVATFGAGQLPHRGEDLLISGSVGTNKIILHFEGLINSFYGWSFAKWSANDRLTFIGSGDEDHFSGTSMDDLILGLDGNDELVLTGGNDSAYGGVGDDLISTAIDAVSSARADGGSGRDTFSNNLARTGLTIDLSLDGPIDIGNGMLIDNFERLNLRLSDEVDVIVGGALDDYVSISDTSDDSVDGGGGDDRVLFQPLFDSDEGGNVIVTLPGAMVLDGGTGRDELQFVADDVTSPILLDLRRPDRVVDTGIGVFFSGFESLYAVTGDGADTVYGGQLADGVYARDGADLIKGGGGTDTLRGEGGADTLVGGANGDLLTGGTGSDWFVYVKTSDSAVSTGTDRIGDFSGKFDRIDLSAIDANTGLSGNDAFTFIASAAFGRHAGEVRFSTSLLTTTIQADTDGNGVADLVIVLTGAVSLTETNFVL